MCLACVQRQSDWSAPSQLPALWLPLEFAALADREWREGESNRTRLAEEGLSQRVPELADWSGERCRCQRQALWVDPR